MKVLVICVLLAPSVAEMVDFYRPCDPSKNNVNYVDIEPCHALRYTDGQKGCQFHLNTVIQLHVGFHTETAITGAKPVVSGLVGGELGVFVLRNIFRVPQDACTSMEPSCTGDNAIPAKSDVNYTASFFVSPEYAEWPVIARWELHDLQNHPILCFLFNVELRE